MSPSKENNSTSQQADQPLDEKELQLLLELQKEKDEGALKFAAKLESMEFEDDSDLSAKLLEQLTEIMKEDIEKAQQEIRYRTVVEKVLNSAIMSSLPSEKLIKCFEMLASHPKKDLTCTEIMNIISNCQQFDRFHCMAAMAKFLRSYVAHIGCTQFDDMQSCKNFVEHLYSLIRWLITGAQVTMKNYNIDQATCTKMAVDLLNTTKIYLLEPFVFRTFQIVTQRKLFPSITSPLSQLKNLNKTMSQCKETQDFLDAFVNISELIMEPIDPLPPHYFNEIGKLQRRPGIRTLASIFLSFRVLTPASEIAETIELLGTINSYTKSQVPLDILHASLLIMLEEFPSSSEELHQLAGQQPERTKVPLDVYKLNLCNIYFKKFPQVFEILIQREYLTFEDVLQAAENMIGTFKHELDMLDFALKDNSIECFLNEFSKNHPAEAIDRVKQLRVEQIKHTELNNLIIRAKEGKKQVPPIAAVGELLHTTAVTKEKVQGFENCIKEIIDKDQLLFDSYLSWFTVEGSITNWTQRAASMLMAAEKKFVEDGKNSSSNLENFALFFHILARVSWYYTSISLEDLVTGGSGDHQENLECGFYKWSKINVMKIVKKEEDLNDQNGANESRIDVLDTTADLNQTETIKQEIIEPEEVQLPEPEVPKFTEEMRLKCINLAHKTTFWDLKNESPYSLIELVPTIGEVWLAENKTKNIEVNTYRELFTTLKEFPVMVLCLCQWLECQPQSAPRYAMARGLLEVITEWHKSIPKSGQVFTAGKPMESISWQFLWLQCKLHLSEISEFPPVYHPMSIFQKSIANRIIPKCGRYQVPCVNMMKDGWIHSFRQNFFGVKALRLVDHCNKSNNYRNWTNGFLYNSVKQETQDTTAIGVEIMAAVLFLDPVKSITKTIEVVTDLMLLREPTKSPNKPTKMQSPECTMAVVGTLIQALLIGVWLVNREKECKEPEVKRRRSSLDTPPDQSWKKLEENEDDLDCLDQFIANAINCLQSEVLNGAMRPATAMIYHMLNLIARSPKSRYRDALIKRIPQNMIFRMAVVDPKALPLQVFAEFCEDNQSHSESLLQYHFLLRKCGGI